MKVDRCQQIDTAVQEGMEEIGAALGVGTVLDGEVVNPSLPSLPPNPSLSLSLAPSLSPSL